MMDGNHRAIRDKMKSETRRDEETTDSLDPVESLDVRISLVLQLCPVELVNHLASGIFVPETVRSGFADIVRNIGSVPHDLYSR